MNYRKFEIIAVIFTAILKFLFYDVLDQRFIFIVLMFGFWGGYVFKRVRSSPDILKEWGFRTDNFGSVLKKTLPFGLLAVTVSFVIGWIQGTINPHWHILPLLITYPFFGVLQQFLLMSFVAGNLQSENRFSKPTIILITSVLFGIVHYPYWWLIAGTFALSLFYTHIYLKQRNLYVLGIFHGWLGAIFYFTVVDQDPFVEVFGPLIEVISSM